MRIVVFEDMDDKFEAIRAELSKKGVKDAAIHRVKTVAQFASIGGSSPDLCILDIRMPGVEGGESRSSGREILKMLDYSGHIRVPVLAITAFPEEADNCRDDFAARGCIIYDFDRQEMWSQALDIFLAQARDRGRYDFIIFTALEKERRGFLSDGRVKIESLTRYGIDLWDFELDGRSGTIVLMPRMGLVVAATLVSRVLDQYAPRVVAMSGICAGNGDHSKLGQLLVADMCWEYQSGKWLDDLFEAEPYQANITPATKLAISKIMEDPLLLTHLEAEYTGKFRPAERSSPKIAPFATGSAVIASEKRLGSIRLQHRKFAGLDMEIFGFYVASELSGHQLQTFAAKVVVDDATNTKGDSLHEYGSFVSAKFVLDMVSNLLR
ncbi:response regulator [Mesorhizobium sp. B2-1-8]|uniref:phosphorylase family protein n=1 Tax=Mesorhizobium sp. B2-1-8 TaxID=2589967 RepID=UPI00112835EF|nr:response regulator [Mesorhizobium sp. B2-1-8]UCI21964.1 response regulator [Mesorhizobium sp. B2-1-8]